MRGGKRPNAGRKAGSPNKASIERQAEVAASGTTPLDYMLEVMRDLTQPFDRRDEMAKAAAPYVHPRLASSEVKSETTVRYVARVPEKAQTGKAWQQQHAPATKHIQ